METRHSRGPVCLHTALPFKSSSISVRTTEDSSPIRPGREPGRPDGGQSRLRIGRTNMDGCPCTHIGSTSVTRAQSSQLLVMVTV
eukprot:2866750-Rhodomonas_salina.1